MYSSTQLENHFMKQTTKMKLSLGAVHIHEKVLNKNLKNKL